MKDNNKRKKRNQRTARKFKLGRYYILTDTEETESNYFEGLKSSLSVDIREQLLIKVIPNAAGMDELINKALELSVKNPNYTEIWLVFDYDNRNRFDEVIKKAEKQQLCVAWSNPCFEIWMYAYFCEMPSVNDSQQCCEKFGTEFFNRIGTKYRKSDTHVYEELCAHGNEVEAIKLAEGKLKNSCDDLPSKSGSCTTVHRLVQRIVSYRENN